MIYLIGVQHFYRELRDWEKEDIVSLVNMLLSACALRSNKEDVLYWKAKNSGCFSVSSVYRWYEFNPYPNDIGVIAKIIWHNVSPPKVKSFVWLAWRQKLKTTVYLQNICIINGSANIACVFCKAEAKSIAAGVFYFYFLFVLLGCCLYFIYLFFSFALLVAC